MAVAGRFAYLAEKPRSNGKIKSGGGLRVLDMTHLTHPQPIGLYGSGGYVKSVGVSTESAILAIQSTILDGAEGESVIDILDVSDPAGPRSISNYRTTEAIQGIEVSQGHLYLTTIPRIFNTEFPGGLHVMDIRRPSQPRLLGKYETSSFVAAVAVTVTTPTWRSIGTGFR